MSSILDVVMSQLGGGTQRQISQALGTDEKTAGNAMSTAIPLLLGALAKNASKPGGAESLHRALQKDHDGSVLNNLGGLIGNVSGGSGSGILKHVLGGRQAAVETGVSKASGLDANATAKLLQMLAPIVMGALGQQQRKQNLNVNALSGLLSQERQAIQMKAPQAMGLVGSLLDSDGDGDVDAADLTKRGKGLLGKLFGR